MTDDKSIHDRVVAEHGARMHDARRRYGPGYVVISHEHGAHVFRYVTTEQHRVNVAAGDFEGELAEAVGKLLTQCADDPGRFPSVMKHACGEYTLNIVNAVPMP